MGEYNVANGTKFDATEAKQTVLDYCLRKGALAAGVADLDALELIAPPGHRPSDIMPKIKSVISLGVGGQTQGAWAVPAKAMGYFGSTETRAYTISYGAAFFIESKYQTPAIYCPPDMDNEKGPRVPLQSLKLHAEVAGIGARSLAGDILLHPEFGYMYFASIFTELGITPRPAHGPKPMPGAVLCFHVPPSRAHPVPEILPRAMPLWWDRRGRQAGGNALRHGCLRRDESTVRGRARVVGAGHGRGRRPGPGRSTVRSRQQDALVQNVGGFRRLAGAVF